MTTNQLKYHELQEKKRSNLVNEQETERHNRRQEQLQKQRNTVDAVTGTASAVLRPFKVTF